MNDQALLHESIMTLSPLNVAAYLRSRRWEPVRKSDGRWIMFAFRGEGRYQDAEVSLPLTTAFLDYASSMAQVVESLSRVEGRGTGEVLEDLRSVDSDMVRFRWVGASLTPGEIPLSGAARLMDGVRDMLSAAAFSAMRPRPFYASGRPPTEVSQFLRDVRVAAAKPGSYVVTVKSVVGPSITTPLFEQATEEDVPFNRRVIRRLAGGLGALQSLIGEMASTDRTPELAPFIDAGLSANLCDAVASIFDEGAQRVDTSVSWSALQSSASQSPFQVVIDRESKEWISAVGKVLKENTAEDDFELNGIVVQLHREPQDLGTVRVLGLVDSKPIQVQAEGVDEEAYNTFLDAHRDGYAIVCRGELMRRGRLSTLRNVRDVRIDRP